MFELSMATCILTLLIGGPHRTSTLILMRCFRKNDNSNNYHSNFKDLDINREIDKLSQPIEIISI
jgi:hypothetical protein